jgi:hypothetical protein
VWRSKIREPVFWLWRSCSFSGSAFTPIGSYIFILIFFSIYTNVKRHIKTVINGRQQNDKNCSSLIPSNLTDPKRIPSCQPAYCNHTLKKSFLKPPFKAQWQKLVVDFSLFFFLSLIYCLSIEDRTMDSRRWIFSPGLIQLNLFESVRMLTRFTC